MQLNTKLLLLMSLLFIGLTAIFWQFSKTMTQQINEEWASRYVKKQIVFDKYRTLTPIIREMKRVRQLSKEPSLIAMAKNETDPLLYTEGIKTLERYRNYFEDRSYFAAFSKTGHYYFNDQLNQYAGKQLQYTLSPTKPNDSWFYTSMDSPDDVGINVDRDAVLGITKIWVNCLLKEGDTILGVVGTGFDFKQFVEESVAIEQEGVRNYFIDHQMAIQLAKEASVIDYASFTKKDGEHKTIDFLFDNREDREHIQKIMQEIRSSSDTDTVKTVWITIDGKKQLVGIAYLPEINWYNLTIIEADELVIIDNMLVFGVLTLLLLSILIILNRVHDRILIKPINQLKYQMKRIENGENDLDLPTIGEGEIADLSRQFNTLIEYVRENNRQLEEKIQERTAVLAQSEQKFRTLFDSTRDAVMLLDEKGFFECNQATLEIFECPDHESFYALHPADLSPSFQPDGVDSITLAQEHIQKALKEGRDQFEWVHRRYESKADFYAEVTLNAVTIHGRNALQAMVRDISQRKNDEEAIHQLAFYDPLTHLPNRRLLDERIEYAIKKSKRSGEKGAVMFLDLDNFKPLNDLYGHDAGDILLVESARRIRECLRESDTVARFGGDEFVIVLEEIGTDLEASKDHASALGDKILHALNQDFAIFKDGTLITHHCTASIGIVLFDRDTLGREEILKQADSAMYHAKESGRNRVCFFEMSFNQFGRE